MVNKIRTDSKCSQSGARTTKFHREKLPFVQLVTQTTKFGCSENAERGVRSAECGVRSAECGVRSAECGVRSAEKKRN